jgi:hypothetical protein
MGGPKRQAALEAEMRSSVSTLFWFVVAMVDEDLHILLKPILRRRRGDTTS